MPSCYGFQPLAFSQALRFDLPETYPNMPARLTLSLDIPFDKSLHSVL
jgi:hypothetical protein